MTDPTDISREPVYVDWRTGSGELLSTLQTVGLRAELAGPGKGQLEAGDFCFMGYGHRGLCMVGIERKTITDLLGCMRDNRLVDIQFPRMLKLYDHRYLIIEGLNRAHPDTGILQQGWQNRDGKLYWQDVLLGRQRFMWQDFDGFLTTLEHSPVRIRRTYDEWQTARTIRAMHHWYTKCTWDRHKSLKGLYYQPNPVMSLDLDEKDLVRRWAADLRHIGPERSLAVSQKFSTGLELATASVDDWKIPGVIGPVIARRVWQEIRGMGSDNNKSAVEEVKA